MKKRLVIVNKFRFITSMVILILLCSLLLNGIFFTIKAYAEKEKFHTKEITIEGGDTLWSIAKEYKPSELDTRYMVHTISNLNSIHNGEIYPGDIILVPIIKNNE